LTSKLPSINTVDQICGHNIVKYVYISTLGVLKMGHPHFIMVASILTHGPLTWMIWGYPHDFGNLDIITSDSTNKNSGVSRPKPTIGWFEIVVSWRFS
jgi:hypothetical protein